MNYKEKITSRTLVIITGIILILLFVLALSGCKHNNEKSDLEGYKHYIAYPWANGLEVPLIGIPDISYEELNKTVDTIFIYLKMKDTTDWEDSDEWHTIWYNELDTNSNGEVDSEEYHGKEGKSEYGEYEYNEWMEMQ